MNELLTENWWLVVAALVIGLLVAWWIFSRSSRTTVIEREETAKDAPATARRNQALIDAPPASATQTVNRTAEAEAAAQGEAIAPSVAGMGGIGGAVAAAAMQPDTETPEAAPAPTPAPTAEPAPEVGQADDLTRIKGIGPRIVAKLSALGVDRFAQIAAWTQEDAQTFDEKINGRGRIARDRWVEQANLLATNDIAAYESQFGKL